MASLYAVLMPGKGPRGAAAADSQARVGTVLGDVRSCRTLVTGEHLASGTVNVAVRASETQSLLFRLSCDGAEESKLKEIREVSDSREEQSTSSDNNAAITTAQDLVCITSV